MKTVVIVNQDQMGSGDAQLGRRLLQTFLTKAPRALRELEAIVFYNSGVRCLVEGSEMAAPLKTLEDEGVELIACGTCVDALGLREHIVVGEIKGMDDILAELEGAEKVLTL